jgi:hypothetical protein
MAMRVLPSQLMRLLRMRIEDFSAELKRLERVQACRTMTPNAERFWIGETVAEEIEKAQRRKTSLEGAARALAARYPAAAGVR